MITRRGMAAAVGAAVLMLGVCAGGDQDAAKKKPAPYALLFGTVWTADQRAAPGVKVKIRREGDKKAKWELLSDRRGEFAQRVPAGKVEYVLWVEGKDKKAPIAETRVQVEYDERVDVGLHLKGAGEIP